MVRAYPPSKLLPLICELASEVPVGEWSARIDGRLVTSWALADMTRVSIAQSSELRHGKPTRRDALRCASAYLQLDDPELRTSQPQALERFLLRTAAEQFDHQGNPLYQVARTSALTASAPAAMLEIMKPGWAERLLRCALDEYLALGLFILYSQQPNRGRFEESFFEHPELLGILGTLTPGRAAAIYRELFTQDAEQFKKAVRPNDRPAPYRRVTYNPLVSKPALTGFAREDLIPNPALLSRKLSPLGLYHIGIEACGEAFARDFGRQFESYVGRHLGLAEGVVAYPEIEYGSKRSRKKSVDWFVVGSSSVVLVEVKSVRPTEAVRTGGEDAASEIRRMLGKAMDQIARSDTEIAERNAAFSHIPFDRPRIGLVVTLEDFHVVSNDLIRSFATLESSIPTVICSIGELEMAAVGTDGLDGFLKMVAEAEPARGNSIRGFSESLTPRENPILTEAWDKLPIHIFVDAF